MRRVLGALGYTLAYLVITVAAISAVFTWVPS